MTNKELNQAIRNELKEAGYKTKDFSISVRDAGYSTSVRIKIKSPYINRKEVEKLLKHHDEVDYDMHTMEILAGGNTYLHIEYDYGIFEEVAQEWATTANGLMHSKDETTRIFDGLYLINWEHSGKLEIRQQDSKEHCTFIVYDFKHLCEFLFKYATFGTIAV